MGIAALNRDITQVGFSLWLDHADSREHCTQHTLLQGGGAKGPRAKAKIASTAFPPRCSRVAHCHLLGVGALCGNWLRDQVPFCVLI